MLVDFIICNPCRMIAKPVKGHVDCCNYFSHIVYLPYEMLPAGRSQVQASLKKSLQQFWLKDAALHANPAYEEHVIAVLRRQ